MHPDLLIYLYELIGQLTAEVHLLFFIGCFQQHVSEIYLNKMCI